MCSMYLFLYFHMGTRAPDCCIYLYIAKTLLFSEVVCGTSEGTLLAFPPAWKVCTVIFLCVEHLFAHSSDAQELLFIEMPWILNVLASLFSRTALNFL